MIAKNMFALMQSLLSMPTFLFLLISIAIPSEDLEYFSNQTPKENHYVVFMRMPRYVLKLKQTGSLGNWKFGTAVGKKELENMASIFGSLFCCWMTKTR